MLIVSLQAVEYMLKNEPDFKPNRTVILAYGADEEVSGKWGAIYIIKVLLDRYGNMITNYIGEWVTAPATGEKGYVTLQVDHAAPGDTLPHNQTILQLV